MKQFPWERFYREKLTKIFMDKKEVLDIGGGLRISREKSNKVTLENFWMLEYIALLDYKVMDPVPDYNPDIIGDIHKMPMADNSLESIVCNAVLEHVENPLLAISEMYRTLKPGGYLFLYIPFLYYYHAHTGYYKDFWRITKDGIDYGFRDFSVVEKCQLHGAIATWLKISPFSRFKFIIRLADYLDILFGKDKSNQTSGYYIFCIK